jgi:MFS family permease
MMFAGITLMIISALMLLISSWLNIFTVSSIIAPSFIITMSVGITIPNATAGAFSELKGGLGTAGAIYGFSQIIVTILTTTFITRITKLTQWHLGYIFLVLGLISLAVYSYITYTQKHLPNPCTT